MNLVGRKFAIHFEKYRKFFPFSFWQREEGHVKKLEIIFFSLVSEYETTPYNRKLSKNSSTMQICGSRKKVVLLSEKTIQKLVPTAVGKRDQRQPVKE